MTSVLCLREPQKLYWMFAATILMIKAKFAHLMT
jgi:hypothetical protein